MSEYKVEKLEDSLMHLRDLIYRMQAEVERLDDQLWWWQKMAIGSALINLSLLCAILGLL